MKSETNLARTACEIAAQSAVSYIDQNNLKVDTPTLSRVLAAEIKQDIITALDDAKEALDINMGQVAEATFRATMRLTGINAVKKLI